MMRRGLGLGIALVTGCGGPEEPAPAATWDDVGPIVEARCAGCHQADGIGTMSLTTWEDAAPWAEAMAAATSARTMPPWLALSDGSCGEFRDSEALSEEEIAVFTAWAEEGAPKGRGRALTPVPPRALAQRDRTLATPLDSPEPEGDVFAPTDEYRCALVRNDATEDFFITGSEVVPGNPSIVHHAILFVVDPEQEGWDGTRNADLIAAMEAEDPRPGWDCLGTVGGSARERGAPVDWAPGQGPVSWPEGVGFRVRPGDWFVIQTHYAMPTVDLRGQSDSTTVHLRTAESVEHEVHLALVDRFIESMYSLDPDTLPAGREQTSYTWDVSGESLGWYAYLDEPVERLKVWAIAPHMHQKGLRQTVTIDPVQGRKTCAVDVPQWDFAWQRIYFYEEPLVVERTDRVQVRCTYDTTDADRDVLPGWGTDNEMCLIGMMVSVE